MGGDGWVEGGGDLRVVITPHLHLSLSIHWCRNILDAQGRPPLAEGQRGFLLKRREIVASLGKWRESLGKVVHYCLCTGGIAPHGFR